MGSVVCLMVPTGMWCFTFLLPAHAMNVPAQPETLPPSQTFYREYLDRLSVGEGVIARSDEDGWYFPGINIRLYMCASYFPL